MEDKEPTERDNNAPPDLDEAFKKLQEKLNSIFDEKNENKVKLKYPIGSYLLAITDFIFKKDIHEKIFCALVNEERSEYLKAIKENRNYKAKWIHIRLACEFFVTLSLHLSKKTIGRFIRELLSFIKD